MEPQIQNQTLDDVLEHKKLIAKLEDELEKKEYELSSVMKIYQDLKTVYEKTRKECTDLNTKLITSYNDKNTLEQKYENEISRLKSNYDKQKEIYEQQILKLSSYDPESLKNKVQNETEVKFKQIIAQKDMEIDDLNNTLNDIKRRNELIIAEYETFKNDAIKELNTQREIHQNEVKDLMHKIEIQNDKVSNNIDKDTFREIKNELDAARKHVNELTNEIDNLRRDKEQLTIERNELKMNSMKEVDKERFNNKFLTTENERNSALLIQAKKELDISRMQLNEKTNEIKDLIKDKMDLVKQLHENENEFQNFKTEIITLRNRLESHEKEMTENLKQTHEEHKITLFKEKTDKENYQKQIEDLTNELKDVKINFKNYHESSSNEMKNLERDYYMLQEEKRMLLQQKTDLQNDLNNLHNDYEIKANAAQEYEREYFNIETKYREVCQREAALINEKNDFERKLRDKSKQIENLNDYVNGMKNASDDKAYAALMKKYKEAIKKKKYYKTQCKIANENISNIIKKLNPDDKKRMEEITGNINLYNPVISQSQSEASMN